MSYSVVCYLTDASAIKRLYGCKNEALLSTLSAALEEELDDLNDAFETQTAGAINAQAILKDFINGETRFQETAFLYGYVYEKLCQYYGEEVVPPNDEFSPNYYWAVPKQTYKSFIPIPFSSDFPELYSITVNELHTEQKRFLALTQREGADEAYLKMEQEDFAFAFEQAIAANKDLVFFLY